MSKGMKNALKVIFSIVVIIVIILLLLRSCGSRKYDVTFLLGAKSKDDLVEKELFEQYGEVCIKIITNHYLF